MKKKILFISLMVALLVCIFAVSASAALVPLDSDPGLDCDESKVSTLDSISSDGITDTESRSVFLIDSKYYVFPSYYFISKSSTYSTSLDNLNSALKSELNVTDSPITSLKTQLIRVELPSYVTTINGSKFENHTALKEVILSDNFTKIGCMDAFGGCTALEYISSIENLTQIGSATFTGCKNLAVDIVWPSAVTTVPSRVFQNCNALKSVTFSEGLTSVGEKAFQNCDTLTKIILPNTVTSVGKTAFGSCDNLVELNFGASFTTFSSGNYDYETTQSSNKLKYVYLPAIDIGYIVDKYVETGTKYGRHIFGSDSKSNVTFFYTGTLAQAQQLKEDFTTIGYNDIIAKATLVEYNPNQNYTGYAESLGYSIIVYNYNPCEAFYNGVHSNENDDHDCTTALECARTGCNVTIEAKEHTVTVVWTYENGYCAEGTKVITCNNEKGCVHGTKGVDKEGTTTTNPFFEALGYSTREDGSGGLTAGYKLDVDAINEYIELYPDAQFTVGLIIVNSETVGSTLFDENGALTGKGIQIEVKKFEYSIINVSINDFSTKLAAELNIAMALYVKDGNGYQYVQAEKNSDYYETSAVGDAILEKVTLVNVAKAKGISELKLSDGSLSVSD